jgi:predicted ATP-binding protein involved in virulence
LSTEQHIYITDIYIKELRHLKDVTIPITTAEKGMKHLILTGKNGSGKTSLLETIAHNLNDENFNKLHYNSFEIAKIKKEYEGLDDEEAKSVLNAFEYDLYFFSGGINLKFNVSQDYLNHIAINPNKFYAKFAETTRVFFWAKRRYKPIQPISIEKIDPPDTAIAYDNSKNFLRFLVLLRNMLTDASYTKNDKEVKIIENWFKSFEKTLRAIFGDENLRLEYNRLELNFVIHQTGRNVFDFNSLPDGYASILRIVTELMLRMEKDKTSAYDAKGIVLIDEIEAHLHIELQKNILPLLTTLFPNIQFIVSTHSPFILNSIENAVVYDLETGMHFEDASEISVSSLIENYFLVKSDYSALMDKKINDFEALASKKERTDAEDEKLADLLSDLKTLSPLLSPEMYLRFTAAQKQLLKPAKANA